jgi:chromosomal replication initiator protein
VPVDEILGTKRSQNIVLPRQVAMYLSRELTSSSLPTIGRAFGGKDHTTVMHSIQKVQKLMETDKQLEDMVEEIARHLKNGNGRK